MTISKEKQSEYNRAYRLKNKERLQKKAQEYGKKKRQAIAHFFTRNGKSLYGSILTDSW